MTNAGDAALLVLLVSSVSGLVVTVLAPLALGGGRWWLHHPQLALRVWQLTFAVGATLVVVAVGTAALFLSTRPNPATGLSRMIVGDGLLVLLVGAVVAGLSIGMARSEQVVGRVIDERRAMTWLAGAGDEREDLSLDGCRVVVIPSEHAIACCLIGDEPRVFVTRSMLEGLAADEVRAVVLHEHGHRVMRHHRACVLGDLAERWTPWLPAAVALSRATALLVELAADDYAARAVGEPALASALATLERRFPGQAYRERARRLHQRTTGA